MTLVQPLISKKQLRSQILNFAVTQCPYQKVSTTVTGPSHLIPLSGTQVAQLTGARQGGGSQVKHSSTLTCHFRAIFMPFSCHFHAIFMPFSCHFHAISMPFPCHFHAISMPFSCHFHAIFCHFHAIFMPFSCHFFAIFMPFSCHFYAIYMSFLCHFHVNVDEIPLGT